MATASSMQQGPPYPPRGAQVGGLPTVAVDVPICTVFMAVYLASAATNMFLFQTNRRKGHLFFISALLFGFSMARVLTMTLRIVWASKPHDVQVAIAASIFVNAGVLIVYIVNLLFAQRLLRARQPELGWHRALHYFFLVMYVLIGLMLAVTITMIVLSFYTLNEKLLSSIRDVELAALTYITVFAATPLVLLVATHLFRKSKDHQHFGDGSLAHKAIILTASTCLSLIIAGFRCGTTWSSPRPATNPAWYQSKASFYCFNFVIEIMILVLFISMRIDKRFHVPNGSSKRRTFEDGDLDEPQDTQSSDEPDRLGSARSGETDLEKAEKSDE